MPFAPPPQKAKVNLSALNNSAVGRAISRRLLYRLHLAIYGHELASDLSDGEHRFASPSILGKGVLAAEVSTV